MGRPAKPVGERLVPIATRVRPSVRLAWEAAAKRAGRSLSAHVAAKLSEAVEPGGGSRG